MTREHGKPPAAGGIVIEGLLPQDVDAARHRFLTHLRELGLARCVVATEQQDPPQRHVGFRLRQEFRDLWTPRFDTVGLCEKLYLDTLHSPVDLEREILIAMLAGPVPFEFPSCDELFCAVSIRKNIVAAARKATLSFHTTEAERPADCWTYTEGRGFTVRSGKSLIAALQKAIQPNEPGVAYSFSCYRATEYVILLGLAQELVVCNPDLYAELQTRWETRPIMSREFHDVFLREYGSMADPLPLKYFVPGDRVWFRNPDEHSADVTGYEGSWVIYLGAGLFNNFWKPAEPYTLTAKCVEMYHWRDGAFRDQAGELKMDEAVVERKMRDSMRDPIQLERILAKMMRHREPGGLYRDGGCIDTTRECPRRVRPGTADLVIPAG